MLEVPQLLHLAGRWRLLYCTPRHTPAHLARSGPAGAWSGTDALAGPGPRGPFRPAADPPLAADLPGTDDAGRVVEDGPDGVPVLLAFRQWAPDGTFAGALSNPALLLLSRDGRLSLDPALLWPTP